MSDESLSRRPPSLLALSTYVAGWYSKRARADVQAALTQFDLGTPEFGVLTALADFGALSQQDLADGLGADKSNVVRLVDQLENRSLVRRSPDPTDRRRHRVAMTAKGRTLIAKAQAAAAQADAQHLNVLSTTERHTLNSLLQRALEAQDGVPGRS